MEALIEKKADVNFRSEPLINVRGRQRSKFGDMTALQDAASIAGLLITTEAMIAEKPEPKAAAGGGMPDMGGMGGMDF